MGGCLPLGLWKSPQSRVLLVLWIILHHPGYICLFSVLIWSLVYYTARYPLVDLDHSNVSTYLLLYLPDSSDLQEEELIAYKLLIHLSFKICPQNNAPSSPTFRLSIYTSMPAIKVLMPLPALTSTKAFSASSNFTVSVINFLTSTLPDATSPTASL